MTDNESTVEAVAKALHDDYWPDEDWDSLEETFKDIWRKSARAALAAIPEPATVGGVTEWDVQEAATERYGIQLSGERLAFVRGARWGSGKSDIATIPPEYLGTTVAILPPAPSTVGTVEELEALPVGTLLGCVGEVYRRDDREAGSPWAFECLTSPEWENGGYETISATGLWWFAFDLTKQVSRLTILTPATTRDVGTIKAETLTEAADAIQALHPGEVKASVEFLRNRADSAKGDGK